MKVHWQKLFVKATVWLAAEIALNLVGLDNLADYSEFLLSQYDLLVGDGLQACPTLVIPQTFRPAPFSV